MKTNNIIKKPITKTVRRSAKKPVRRFDVVKKKLDRRVKLMVVPQSANQYRPHLIRRYGLVAVLLLVIGVQAGYNIVSTGRVLGQRQAVSTVALLADTNARRIDGGLPPLQLDEKLQHAAQLKGQDMFAKQYWAHDSPEGVTPWYWFDVTGYSYAYAGENLAKNFATADAATTAWMASPDHRANIMDVHYTQAGFAVIDGVLKGEPVSVIVALYGEPAADIAAASVAGVHNASLIVDAPAPHNLSLLARIGVAVQSLSPATIGGVLLMLLVAVVAVVAQLNRKKLPAPLRRTWYRNHGAIKAGGMLSISFVVLYLYGGGQI